MLEIIQNFPTIVILIILTQNQGSKLTPSQSHSPSDYRVL